MELCDYLRYMGDRLIWDTFPLHFTCLWGRRTESRTVLYTRQEKLSLDRHVV